MRLAVRFQKVRRMIAGSAALDQGDCRTEPVVVRSFRAVPDSSGPNGLPRCESIMRRGQRDHHQQYLHTDPHSSSVQVCDMMVFGPQGDVVVGQDSS